MSSTRDFKAPAILAEEAETTIPTTPVSGLSYRNVDTSDAVIQKGFLYDTIVDSASLMNQFQYMLSRMMKTVEQQGILGWCDLVDYGVNAFVIGSDGILYKSIRASGPNSGGAKDPITQVTTWESYVQKQAPGVPVGMVMAYTAVTPPDGWLGCNGAYLSRTDYADLYAVIGTTWGVGDGSQFKLPDLRGEFIRGWTEGRGTDPSRVFGTSQGDAFQGHRFEVTRNTRGEDMSISQKSGVGGSQYIAQGSDTPDDVLEGVYPVADKVITDGIHGTPRISAENRPRNVALKYCIKY